MLKSSAVKPYYHVVDTPYGKYTISPSGNTVGSTKKIQKLIEEIKSIIASGK
jgi:hypothetical protein